MPRPRRERAWEALCPTTSPSGAGELRLSVRAERLTAGPRPRAAGASHRAAGPAHLPARFCSFFLQHCSMLDLIVSSRCSISHAIVTGVPSVRPLQQPAALGANPAEAAALLNLPQAAWSLVIERRVRLTFAFHQPSQPARVSAAAGNSTPASLLSAPAAAFRTGVKIRGERRRQMNSASVLLSRPGAPQFSAAAAAARADRQRFASPLCMSGWTLGVPGAPGRHQSVMAA